MKRKMFLIGTMALMFASSIFWSCQKDEFVPNPENGMMLKNAILNLPACNAGCITEPEIYAGPVFKGKIGNPSYSETGSLQVYNTKDNLIVKVSLTSDVVAAIHVSINEVDYFYDKDEIPAISNYVTTSVLNAQQKISWLQVTLPLTSNISCTEFKISASTDGQGGASVLYKQYEWCEDCDDANFSYETTDNLDITFKYNHDEEVEDVTIQFNFPQVINAILNDDGKYVGADGKLYDVNNAKNQTVFTWTGRVSCSESEAETFHFEHAADCSSPSAKDGKANIWTDAKIVAINGVTLVDDPLTTDIYEGPISLKGSLSNIVYEGCPVNK